MTANPAAYLRETAERIKSCAVAVPHGRWKWIVADNPARWQLVTNDTLVDIATCTENPDMPPSIAEHIASWDPDAALAVADWLDDEANRCDIETRVHGRVSDYTAATPALAFCRTFNRAGEAS